MRFDTKGNIYVAERDNHVVRYIDMKSKMISTAAGTGMRGFGGDGGPANQAQLAQPHSIALDRADNVYICDIVNNRVRRIDPKGGPSAPLLETENEGRTPERASLDAAPVAGPRSIEIAPDGTMYLILREGNKVFSIDVAGRRLKRIAGTGELGYTGDGSTALSAKFGIPDETEKQPERRGTCRRHALHCRYREPRYSSNRHEVRHQPSSAPASVATVRMAIRFPASSHVRTESLFRGIRFISVTVRITIHPGLEIK